MWKKSRAWLCTLILLSATVVFSACVPDQQDKTIRLALVDRGVSPSLPVFSEYRISHDEHAAVGDHGTMMLSIALGVNGADVVDVPASRVEVQSIVVTQDGADGIAEAIERASGADVISISMGVRLNSERLTVSAERAVSQGSVIIAAAGNVRFLQPDYPARLSSAISVGALDADGELWRGSARKGLDAKSLGVDVPVIAANGKSRLETGTSVAAAKVTYDALSQLTSGRIRRGSEYSP